MVSMASPLKSILATLALIVLAALAPPAHAQAQPQALSAFVDRTNITINDVITLTLRLDVSLGNSRPQLSGLNQNFEQVGGLSSRSTYTNTNGNIQAWTEYSIMLRPLSTGTLTIPSFRIGGQTTDPISVTVSDATAATGDNSDDIFLRTTISKTESYVQEQLLYTIRIYYSVGFDQGAQLSAPEVENAVVQQLGSDSNFQEVVNGISYQVTERKFVMFPQQSGDFRIAPVFFNATVGRRGGINRFLPGRTAVREISLVSDEHVVNVKAQPDTFDGLTWLPASQLTLEETWSGDLANVHVGDAVTRNVTMTATGLSSSLLPAIEYQDLPGLRFYPDQPVREDTANGDGVIGKRSEGTAIVASQPGEFVLPEVKLPWWNTRTDMMEYATLPSRTIMVLPAVNAPDNNSVTPGTTTDPVTGAAVPPAGTVAAGSNPLWISTTVLFATLWAFTCFLWLRSRQQLAYVETTGVPQTASALRMPEAVAGGKAEALAVASADADTALRVLKTACDNRHFGDIRKAVLKWGQGSFHDSSLQTLAQLASACNDDALTHLLRSLDTAMYGGNLADVNTKALYDCVAQLHKKGVGKAAAGNKYALPPLYKA